MVYRFWCKSQVLINYVRLPAIKVWLCYKMDIDIQNHTYKNQIHNIRKVSCQQKFSLEQLVEFSSSKT